MVQELTQESLRTILSIIFNISEEFITLKQGNWFGAQAVQDNITDKPLTWIRYKILNDIPITTTGLDEDDDPDSPILDNSNEPVLDDDGNPTYEQMQVLITQVITPIELDFIGIRAELCAKSIKNWLNRSDVEEQFNTVGAKVMAVERAAASFNYVQEGLNNTLAYNSNFRLARKSIQPTGALKLDQSYNIILEGGV